MNIDYNRTRLSEAAARSRFRSALLHICPILAEGSPLDRLLGDKDAPATKVKEQLQQVLAYENELFRSYVDEERAALSEMVDYCDKCIEVEKAEAHAKRLVTQAIKAGLKYGMIQSMVVREMDRRDHAWPSEGW